MNIQIDLKLYSISSGIFRINPRYDIYINEDNTHYAEYISFCVPYGIRLYTNNKDKTINLRSTIRMCFSFLSPHYTIKLLNNDQLFHFCTISLKDRHFQCKYGYDIYDIYGYPKRRYSVFKNNEQIAVWQKKWSGITPYADQLFITADDDCDHELIMAFCLILDKTYTSLPGRITSIWFPARASFNDRWVPKTTFT